MSRIVVCLTACVLTLVASKARADDGCMGDCGNRRQSAAGWCGNCRDHCSGGTEAECTNGCKEKCEQAKRDNDWRAKCEAAKRKRDDDCRNANGDAAKGHFCSESGDGWKGNTAAIGHWCAGDGKKGADAAIGHWCAGDGWNGCLTTCGGQKGCRDSWCVEKGPQRQACYKQVEEAHGACSTSCGQPPTKCSEEKCMGIVRYAKCDGKVKATGFCVSWSWPL